MLHSTKPYMRFSLMNFPASHRLWQLIGVLQQPSIFKRIGKRWCGILLSEGRLEIGSWSYCLLWEVIWDIGDWDGG